MGIEVFTSVIIFGIGIGLGILVQRYILSRGTHVALLEKEITQLKGEQLQLKDSIEQHFAQTSDLASNLTNSYRELYNHMAKGASEFTEQPLMDLQRMLLQDAEAKPVNAPKDYADQATDEPVSS